MVIHRPNPVRFLRDDALSACYHLHHLQVDFKSQFCDSEIITHHCGFLRPGEYMKNHMGCKRSAAYVADGTWPRKTSMPEVQRSSATLCQWHWPPSNKNVTGWSKCATMNSTSRSQLFLMIYLSNIVKMWFADENKWPFFDHFCFWPNKHFFYTVLRADSGTNSGLGPKPLKSWF